MKTKSLYLATAALAMLGAVAAPAAAADKVFALVPKALGVQFYADAETGCEEAAAKIGAECLFTGPSQLDDAEQNCIVRDLITKKVAGISVAPNNPDSIASAISLAIEKGIPVVTFDSDAPNSERIAFIGTNNRAGGEAAGEAFVKAMPEGGTYAVLTGGLSAANLNERIEGFHAKLGDKFTEIDGSPFACNDNSATAVQIIQDVLAKNPDLDGIFYVGGWPMFAPQAYARALSKKHDDIKAGKFVVVSFDTLPTQVQLLKDGFATTLVGQRPLAMGEQSIEQLNKLSEGEQIPPVTDTGVDIVDASNVDQFMSN